MTQQQVTNRTGIAFSTKGGQAQPTQGEYGDVHVSQFLPPLARLALEGKIYTIDTSGGTAIAPVVAMPTTSPQWGLYNASPDETLVVLKVAVSLQGGTAGLGLSIVGAAAIGAQTVVAADYAGTVKSRSNGSAVGPDVFLKDNPTLVGGTPAWFSYAQTQVNSIAVNGVGSGLKADIDGALVAGPGGQMVAFEIVGETGTTALFDFMAVIAMVKF